MYGNGQFGQLSTILKELSPERSISATKEKYKLIHNRYPIWDDITFAVVKITNRNKTNDNTTNITSPDIPKMVIPDEPQISPRISNFIK